MKRDTKNHFKKLLLKGKAVVFIDWANVHGWEKSLKKDVDITKLFIYLKNYPEITDTRFYFGTDAHEKSIKFLKTAENIGYQIITKPVKHILVGQVDGRKIYHRKCDLIWRFV